MHAKGGGELIVCSIAQSTSALARTVLPKRALTARKTAQPCAKVARPGGPSTRTKARAMVRTLICLFSHES